LLLIFTTVYTLFIKLMSWYIIIMSILQTWYCHYIRIGFWHANICIYYCYIRYAYNSNISKTTPTPLGIKLLSQSTSQLALSRLRQWEWPDRREKCFNVPEHLIQSDGLKDRPFDWHQQYFSGLPPFHLSQVTVHLRFSLAFVYLPTFGSNSYLWLTLRGNCTVVNDYRCVLIILFLFDITSHFWFWISIKVKLSSFQMWVFS
jgi:hypothetical protein